MNNQKGITSTLAIIIVIAIGVIAIGGVLAYQYLWAPEEKVEEEKAEEPYIKVLSPNGGEQWKIGETHNITWAATGLDEVFIAYQRIGSARGGFPLIIGNIPASSSTYLWKITQSVLREDEVEGERRGSFKIYIVEDSILCREIPEDCISDFSDNYFSIVEEKEERIETSNESLEVVLPVPYQGIKSPVKVSGKSNFFEANTRIRIKDDNNKILADTFTMAEGWMGELHSFSKDVSYEKPTSEKGVVEVFEESPKDGSEINKVIIPVVFEDYLDETAD